MTGALWRIEQASAVINGEKERYLCLNFFISGYHGVGEYSQLLHEHCVLLQEGVYVSISKSQVT